MDVDEGSHQNLDLLASMGVYKALSQSKRFSQLMPTDEKIPSTLAYAEVEFKKSRDSVSEHIQRVC